MTMTMDNNNNDNNNNDNNNGHSVVAVAVHDIRSITLSMYAASSVLRIVIDMVVDCLLLVTITVTTAMVSIVAFCTKANNYDQLLVNKPPTNEKPSDVGLVAVVSLCVLFLFC